MQHGNTELVRRARAGELDAIAELLAMYRNYLKLLAHHCVEPALRSKADSSDLVQETLLGATRDLHQFRGTTEAEFLAWLRQILANTAAGLARRYKGAQRRNVQRERSFHSRLEMTSQVFCAALISQDPAPSQIASKREESVLLADAIAKLPDDYRQVLILHHLDGRSVAEIALQMNRSTESIKGLRTRATARLAELLRGVQ